MPGDIYEKGQPLTQRGLFQLVTDEVFRDGVVDDDELAVVKALSRFLGLEREVAMSIVGYSRHKFQRGLLREQRPMDPPGLYEEVLRYIFSDGHLDELELEMLKGLRSLLDIDEEIHSDIVHRLKATFGPVSGA